MNKNVYSPDLDSLLVTGSKKYIPIMIVLGVLVFPALALIGILGNSIAQSNIEEDLTIGLGLTAALMALTVVVFIGLVLLEYRYSRKFSRVSKAMRTAVIIDGDKLTIMECANRQKGRYETFNGSVMFNAGNGINTEDMLAIYNVRTGIKKNNESLDLARAQVQDTDYVLLRYSDRGEDFKYSEYRNPTLIKADSNVLVFEGEKETLQGPQKSKFTVLNIFPGLLKAVG